MSDRDNGQTELEETTRLEDEQAIADRQKEYDDALIRHKANLKDLANCLIALDSDIETATGFSGMQMGLTDQIKGYRRIEPLLERVKFEKVAETVEKSQGLYIGVLKQAHKLVANRIVTLEMNPPEPPE